MAIDKEDVGRFLNLFRANQRSFGQFRPSAKTQAVTVRARYTEEHIRSHLEGEVGLGLVPIQDDDNCMWGAIDIDVHGPNKQNVDLLQIEEKVRTLKLPLVVCRSRSGGAHLYVFMTEPVPAERARLAMTRWASQLGFPSAEIFPKQITVALPKDGNEADRPLGNWLNLPYFDADQTERYAIDGGKQVSFSYFLEICEAKRTDLKSTELVAGISDFALGPPCLQAMLEHKVEENRNIANFQAAIYLKRAFPDDWATRLKEFNQSAMYKPLGRSELNTITGSVRRKDYQYKCRESPCKDFCNKEICRTREFGISAGDEKANEIPMIEKVEKIVATPVRWALTVKGQLVELTTEQLFNYEIVRQKVGEKLHLVLPRIKATEWDVYLHEIMARVEVKHETTIEDLVFQRLCEYLRKASRDKSRDEDERREDLKRGQPALVRIVPYTISDGTPVPDEEKVKWYFAFKPGDFVEYLRRRKQLPVPDHQMWTLIARILGPENKRQKLKTLTTRITNVYLVDEKWVEEEMIPTKEYETEY